MCKGDECDYLYKNLESLVLKADGLYETECWVWQGDHYEYGMYKCSNSNESMFVHRVSCAMFNGPIPEFYVVDHLCEMKLCVNPDHLEAVSNVENVKRARVKKLLRLEKGEPKYDLNWSGSLVERIPKSKPNKLRLDDAGMSVIKVKNGYRLTRAKTLASPEAIELSKWILRSEGIEWIDSI